MSVEMVCPDSVLVGKDKRPPGIHSTYVWKDRRRYDLITGVVSFDLWLSELSFKGLENFIDFLEKEFQTRSAYHVFVYGEGRKRKEVVRTVLPERIVFGFYPWHDDPEPAHAA